MTDVFLEGRLGRVVGKKFSFKTRTLKEAFAVFINGKELDPSAYSLNVNVVGKDVLIIPMLFGAIAVSLTTAIVGAIGLAGSKIATFIVGTLVSAALSFGLNLLISKIMKPDDPEALNTSSFLFGQAENVSKQGVVVPVGYGRMQIGSRVISVNMFNVDRSLYNKSGAGLYDILKLQNDPSTDTTVSPDGVIQISSLVPGGHGP